MKFSSLHKFVTYLLAALGLFCISAGGRMSMPALVVLWLGWGLSFFCEEPRIPIGSPAYARGWTVAVFAVFALQIARGLGGDPLIPLGIEYAGFLQISRLAHRRSARDYQQIAVLALVHLVAASVLSTGLDFAAAFLGFVVAMPWMLSLTHLRGEIEGNYRARSSAGALPEATRRADVERVLGSRRVAGPRFLFGSAALAIPLFLLTAGFFLLFPRVGMGFLSFDNGMGRSVTGFGHNVELGGFGVIRDDPTVVVRIKPFGARRSHGPRTFRLRGTSFDYYDGRRWSRSDSSAVSVRPHGQYYPFDDSQFPAPGTESYRVILDAIDEPVVFLPEGAVGISVMPRVVHGRPVARQIARSAGFDIRYLDGDALGLNYEVFVLPGGGIADDLASGPSRPELHRQEDRPEVAAIEIASSRYLQLPDGLDRISALADDVIARATTRSGLAADRVTDSIRARFLLEYLKDPSQYRYSLEQPDTSGGDPLHIFLFEAKSGHCEYFSTALAVMLRTQGIPARNVTGFLGGRFNPYGEYYAIRQGEAHSWVEAFLGGRWVTLEATPPARNETGPQDSIWSGLSAWMDALRIRWSSDVVGFDLNRQTDAFRAVARWFRSLGAGSSTRGVQHRGGDGDSLGIPAAASSSPWKWVLLGIAALALLLLVRHRYRGKSSQDAPLSKDAASVSRYFRKLESELSRQGYPRHAEETARAWLGRLRAEGYTCIDEIRGFIADYESVRFGGGAFSEAIEEDLNVRLGRIRGARKRAKRT